MQMCLVFKDYSSVLKHVPCFFTTSAYIILVLQGMRFVAWPLSACVLHVYWALIVGLWSAWITFCFLCGTTFKNYCSWELPQLVLMIVCFLLMTWQTKLWRFSIILGKLIFLQNLIFFSLPTVGWLQICKTKVHLELQTRCMMIFCCQLCFLLLGWFFWRETNYACLLLV